MPAYVTLPGTSGNYFDTPDVNLLQADTAHMEQSIGAWSPGGASAPAQAQVLTPTFGNFHGQISGDTGTGGSNLYSSSVGSPTTTGVAVSPSTAYAVGIDLASSDVSKITQAQLRIRWYTAAGALISAEIIQSNTALTTSFARFSGSTTSPGTAAFAIIQQEFTRAGATNGTDFLYFDNPVFRSGTDASFVPSLRIVNDLEIEWKVALDDYTPAATNTVLDCLNSNDGYRIRHTTGDLIEIAYGNGSSTRAQTSSATGLTDGTAHVFKVTVDQSTGAVVYYIDGVQHDTDTMTTGAGQPDINDLVVGANAAASANWTSGDIYYVIVRDGIGGITVARFDADDWVGV